jgi:hypothetical protein
MSNGFLQPVESSGFASLSITEKDLQRLLRTQISVISPDLYVLAEEFSDWEDAWRSIDLLCLDSSANLVVVELKRTEDGGHIELQAIRYAAMVSSMTFEKAVEAHSLFLRSLGRTEDAASAILGFLGWETPDASAFAEDVRIILVSGNFSKEITTSVMWLNRRELDIRCFKLRPYAVGHKTLIDIQQVIPLPEASDYQVKLREKEAEKRQAQAADWTRYDLFVGEATYKALYKRQLAFEIVRALVARKMSPIEMMKTLPQSKFLVVDGNLSADDFRAKAEQMKNTWGTPYNLKRWYLEDDELFHMDGKTYGLTTQWSKYDLPSLDALIAGHSDIRYSPVS